MINRYILGWCGRLDLMKLIGHLFIENFADLVSKLVFSKQLVTSDGRLQRQSMTVVGRRNWFELSQPFFKSRKEKLIEMIFFTFLMLRILLSWVLFFVTPLLNLADSLPVRHIFFTLEKFRQIFLKIEHQRAPVRHFQI